MNRVNCNLSDAQIESIERILAWFDNHIGNAANHTINKNTWAALMKTGVLTYDHTSGNVQITNYGIQSYCATVLTKYDGPTHERIHNALNDYQRLFTGSMRTITQ